MSISYFLGARNRFVSISESRTLEDRLAESTKIFKKYPNRVAIVVEPLSTDMKLVKQKLIVSKDMTFGQLIYIIRNKMNLDSKVALFFTVNDKMCTSNLDIGSIYEKNKQEDNFLYIKYTTENTFG